MCNPLPRECTVFTARTTPRLPTGGCATAPVVLANCLAIDVQLFPQSIPQERSRLHNDACMPPPRALTTTTMDLIVAPFSSTMKLVAATPAPRSSTPPHMALVQGSPPRRHRAKRPPAVQGDSSCNPHRCPPVNRAPHIPIETGLEMGMEESTWLEAGIERESSPEMGIDGGGCAAPMWWLFAERLARCGGTGGGDAHCGEVQGRWRRVCVGNMS